MSSLGQPVKTTISKLGSSADYPIWRAQLRDIAAYKFGHSGNAIITLTPHEIAKPTLPDPNEMKVNPRTGLPTGTPTYEFEPLSEEQIEGFEDDPEAIKGMEMNQSFSKKGQLKWDTDMSAYHTALREHDRKHSTLKNDDNECYQFMVDSITPDAMLSVKAMDDYKTLVAQPFSYTNRSLLLYQLIVQRFSTANSRQITNQLIECFNSKQGPTEPTPSFLERTVTSISYLNDIAGSKKFPGHISLDVITSIIVMSGTKRTEHAIECLKMWMHTHQGTECLDKPHELMQSLLLYSTNPDFTGEDEHHTDSATSLIAKPSTKANAHKGKERVPYGEKVPGRTDHCPLCLSKKSKFIYGHNGKCHYDKTIKSDAAQANASIACLTRLGYLVEKEEEEA